jgi:V8-like Glu-specific endopeptidase
MQGMWDQNGFDKFSECGRLQMNNRDVMTVDSNTISGKKGSNVIIARLDNCFTIAKYAIVDGLDRDQAHSDCHFSSLRS